MSTEKILQQAENLEAESNYEAAYTLCTNALQTDFNNKDLLEKTAMLAKMVGNTQKCIECWERVLELNPANQLAYSELQDLYLDIDKFKYYSMRAKYRVIENKPEAAVDDFKKAISNTDDNKLIIETRLMIASIYKAMGKDEKAENQYLLILDAEPNTIASLLLAESYMKNDDLDAAISTLEQAYKHDKDNIDLKRSMGNLYLRAGNHEKAAEFVTDDYSNVKLLLQQEKNEEAKNILDNYSGKKDDNYYLLYAEYYYNTKQADKCFEAIDEFSKLSPRHPLTFQMRALCHELKGEDAKAKYNWGWYNLMKGQQDIALAEFLDSNDIEKNVDTLEQIVKIYDAQNDKTTAAEFVAQLVELEPKNTLALKRLGEFYQSVGDADSAYDYYSRILEYDPNNLNVLISAAQVAEKIGREEEAMEYYKNIVNISRDEKQVAKAQKRLNILSGEEDENILTKFLDFIKEF